MSVLFSPQTPAAIAASRATLQRAGRVHIPNALPESRAASLHAAMLQTEWRTVLNGEGANVYDLKASDVAAMNPAQEEKLLKVVHAKASSSFQFLFDSRRISDEYESGAVTTGELAEIYTALNSGLALDTLRQLTGEPRIAYVDAQATRYRPGHFLTRHDDDIEGKDRLFAYVLNLTPTWRADWGGLLMFLSPDGHVEEAFTPSWNALNILAVPQPHAVSVVAPFAGAFRYSITGWMRSKRP
jgi:SM-20-related protein